VFELVEVHQRALDLVEAHFLDFGAARNLADEPWHGALAIRTWLINHAPLDEISGAIAQHDTAARVERSKDEFARLAFGHRLARPGIDDLKEAEVGKKVIAAGRLVGGTGTFGPGHFGFGETVGGDDIRLRRADVAGEAAQ